MLNRTYVLWMAGSALVACGAQYLLSSALRRRGLLAALTLLLGAALGIAFAKIGYCLLQMEYVSGYGVREALFSDDLSMMSFYCGMLGVIVGALLASRCTGNPALTTLNAYAPAGALLAALARFGEHFLGLIGAGRYVEDEALCFFPLAVSNEWGEWYVAAHLIAGLLYLAVFGASLCAFRDRRFLRTVFYLCLVQVFCESLRNQSLIWREFIRAEQLICMAAVEVILILLGISAKGTRKRFVPAVVGVLCAGVFVAVEFALDGKILNGVPPVIFYAVMIAGLLALAILENWLVRAQSKRRGQGASARGEEAACGEASARAD